METNDLFGSLITEPVSTKKKVHSIASKAQPLAERLRPQTLDEVVGQQHLLGEGKPLRVAFDESRPHSMILWGPPGVGKTTLARLMAKAFNLPLYCDFSCFERCERHSGCRHCG